MVNFRIMDSDRSPISGVDLAYYLHLLPLQIRVCLHRLRAFLIGKRITLHQAIKIVVPNNISSIYWLTMLDIHLYARANSPTAETI